MKIFVAAAALAVAFPSMAAAQATGHHAGHHAGHDAARHGEEKPCCPGKDGKTAECCLKARKEGKKMPCCDHEQHKAAGHGEGHGAHGDHAGHKAD